MSAMLRRPVFGAFRRALSARAGSDGGMGVHFRNTASVHPLGVSKKNIDVVHESGEWVNPMTNHVWSDEEIKERLSVQPRHQPTNLADRACIGFLKGAYWTFNKVTGYEAVDPTPESVAFRLIFLESVAAVPGMVAAQHRHFRSLRTLERDYGWIHTLLEEAENERMHLLTFLQMFPPGPVTRTVIFGTQFGFGSLFISLYLLSPYTAHRLVGYIEELAVVTYTNIIELMQTPGTKLEQAWNKPGAPLPAPEIAVNYWRLQPDATFFDVVQQVGADECNHRDVNHTFASLSRDDPNPFVVKHSKDAAEATQYWHAAAADGSGKDFLGQQQVVGWGGPAVWRGKPVQADTKAAEARAPDATKSSA